MDLAERIAELDDSLFDTIETQTTTEDRRSLLAVHAAAAEALGSFSYLEIGSHLGGSLQILIADPRCTQITSIDPRPLSQPDDRGAVYTYPDNSTTRMLGLLSQVAHADLSKLVTIEADSTNIDCATLPHIDVCFVDGEHTYASALADAKLCVAALNGSGVIVFHDRSVIESAIRVFLRQTRGVRRSYALRTNLFVVELGDTSISTHPLVRSQLHGSRVIWNTANRVGAVQVVFAAVAVRRRARQRLRGHMEQSR